MGGTGPILEHKVQPEEPGASQTTPYLFGAAQHFRVVEHPHDTCGASRALRPDDLDRDAGQHDSFPARDRAVCVTTGNVTLHDDVWPEPLPRRPQREEITLCANPPDGLRRPKQITEAAEAAFGCFK